MSDNEPSFTARGIGTSVRNFSNKTFQWVFRRAVAEDAFKSLTDTVLNISRVSIFFISILILWAVITESRISVSANVKSEDLTNLGVTEQQLALALSAELQNIGQDLDSILASTSFLYPSDSPSLYDIASVSRPGGDFSSLKFTVFGGDISIRSIAKFLRKQLGLSALEISIDAVKLPATDTPGESDNSAEDLQSEFALFITVINDGAIRQSNPIPLGYNELTTNAAITLAAEYVLEQLNPLQASLYLIENERYDQAGSLLDIVEAQSPQPSSAVRLQAYSLSKRERHSEALETYRLATLQSGDTDGARLSLAFQLMTTPASEKIFEQRVREAQNILESLKNHRRFGDIARLGLARSYAYLGERDRSKKQALALLDKQRNPEQMAFLGLVLNEVGECDASWDLFERAAAKGHRSSQLVVGIGYSKGLFEDDWKKLPSPKLARTWLHAAAKQGDHTAMQLLANELVHLAVSKGQNEVGNSDDSTLEFYSERRIVLATKLELAQILANKTYLDFETVQLTELERVYEMLNDLLDSEEVDVYGLWTALSIITGKPIDDQFFAVLSQGIERGSTSAYYWYVYVSAKSAENSDVQARPLPQPPNPLETDAAYDFFHPKLKAQLVDISFALLNNPLLVSEPEAQRFTHLDADYREALGYAVLNLAAEADSDLAKFAILALQSEVLDLESDRVRVMSHMDDVMAFVCAIEQPEYSPGSAGLVTEAMLEEAKGEIDRLKLLTGYEPKCKNNDVSPAAPLPQICNRSFQTHYLSEYRIWGTN